VSYFLVLSEEEMEIVGFAVNRTIREHRQQLRQILRERLEKLGNGETEVLSWKAAHHDNLIRRLDRLDAISSTLDAAPTGTEPDPNPDPD
jgi:hypothetical protein